MVDHHSCAGLQCKHWTHALREAMFVHRSILFMDGFAQHECRGLKCTHWAHSLRKVFPELKETDASLGLQEHEQPEFLYVAGVGVHDCPGKNICDHWTHGVQDALVAARAELERRNGKGAGKGPDASASSAQW